MFYKIEYKLTLSDGQLVDESDGSPLIFETGDGQLHHSLETCVESLDVGKEEIILISASEGFGDRTDDAIQKMDKDQFPEDIQLKVDSIIEFETPVGDLYPGTIKEINEKDVLIDFNHPLAGFDLTFKVKIIEKSETSITS